MDIWLYTGDSPQKSAKNVFFKGMNLALCLSTWMIRVGWCHYLSWKCVPDTHFQLEQRHQLLVYKYFSMYFYAYLPQIFKSMYLKVNNISHKFLLGICNSLYMSCNISLCMTCIGPCSANPCLLNYCRVVDWLHRPR